MLTPHEILRKLSQLFPLLPDERARKEVLDPLAREPDSDDEMARDDVIIGPR